MQNKQIEKMEVVTSQRPLNGKEANNLQLIKD